MSQIVCLFVGCCLAVLLFCSERVQVLLFESVRFGEACPLSSFCFPLSLSLEERRNEGRERSDSPLFSFPLSLCDLICNFGDKSREVDEGEKNKSFAFSADIFVVFAVFFFGVQRRGYSPKSNCQSLLLHAFSLFFERYHPKQQAVTLSTIQRTKIKQHTKLSF